MQKIKLITRIAGPEGNFPPGSVVLFNQKLTKALIDAGHAVLVDEPIREPEIEPEKAEIKPEKETAKKLKKRR